MATVTRLFFNINTRYDDRGLRKAAAGLKSVQAVAPSAGAATLVAAKAAAQAASAFAAAGGGLAVYALAARNVYRDSEAAQKSVDRLKKRFDSFGHSARASIVAGIQSGTQGAINALKQLEPVVKPVSKVVARLAADFERWTAGPGMRAFSRWLASEAPAAIAGFATAAKQLGSGLLTLGNRLGVFETSGFVTWLVRVTAAFEDWANSPAVGKLATFLDRAAPILSEFLLSALRLAGVLSAALGPAALAVVKALTPVLNVIADLATRFPWLVQGVYLAFLAFKLLAPAIALVKLAWLALNTAFALTPLGWIVIAVALIIAGLVLLYLKFQWFRDAVHAVLKAVGAAAMWLWSNGIKPAWDAIAGAAVWLWHSVLKPAWAGIQAAISTAWSIIRPIFAVIVKIVRAVLGRAFTFLWNIVKIVWVAIQLQIKAAWAILKPIFNAIKWVIENVLAPAFKWVWEKVVRPVFNSVKDKIETVLNDVKSGFKTAVDAIKKHWDKIKGIAKAPVNFVIGLYNDGIVSLVNGIAKFAGIDTRLGRINKFARGGIMPGYSPGRDSLIAAVSPGESIFRPEFTKAVGSRFVATANRVARNGGPGGVRNWLAEGGFADSKGFARGGVVRGGFAGAFGLGGIVKGIISGIKDFSILDPVKAVINFFEDKIIGAAFPGSGFFRDAVAALPGKFFSMLKNWVKKNAGFGGTAGMRKALTWAKTQDNKPYQWAGNGNPSWDCSGFMSAIESVIRGQRPHRRWSTHNFQGGSPPGWQRNRRSGFMIGVRHGGRGGGHTAGTLLNHAVEAGGNGVQVGPPARSHRGFPHQFGFKADSGVLRLQPGWNPPVYNGLGTTEVLETQDARRERTIVIEKFEPKFTGPVGSEMELRNWLVESLTHLERHGRIKGVTQ